MWLSALTDFPHECWLICIKRLYNHSTPCTLYKIQGTLHSLCMVLVYIYTQRGFVGLVPYTYYEQLILAAPICEGCELRLFDDKIKYIIVLRCLEGVYLCAFTCRFLYIETMWLQWPPFSHELVFTFCCRLESYGTRFTYMLTVYCGSRYFNSYEVEGGHERGCSPLLPRYRTPESVVLKAKLCSCE